MRIVGQRAILPWDPYQRFGQVGFATPAIYARYGTGAYLARDDLGRR